MAAKVTAKLALDASGFTATLTKAQAALGKLSAVGVPVIAAGLAAASAAAAGLAVGVKNAIDMGGALSELSSRTGVAAGELRILQLAFTRAGIGADNVGKYINKLQKFIVDAGSGSKESAKTIKDLGLSVSGLSGMSADQQFAAISKAIAALPDPAAKAAAALKIFGRGAGGLLALFSDAGALGDASQAIGSQAKLLTQNATEFDRASDILNTSGAKLEGFFVGMADQIVPALLPLLERADGLDFTSAGQSFGKSIGLATTYLTSGKIGDVLTAQFKLAAANFVNELGKGFTFITSFMQRRLVDIPNDFVTIMSSVTKADFWRGLGSGLLAAVQKVAAFLQKAAADIFEKISKVPFLSSFGQPVNDLRKAAGVADSESAKNFGLAKNAVTSPIEQVKNRISESFNNAIAAASSAVEAAGKTIDTAALEKERNNLVSAVAEEFKVNQEAIRSQFSATKTQIPNVEEMDSRGTNTGIIAQSLQKVGGGAAFARFSDAANPAAQAVREQQKTNTLLGRIEQKLSPQMALMPA
jgi:hypothetical protein